MQVYCKKEDVFNIKEKIEWCQEFGTISGTFIRCDLQRCIELVKTEKCMILGQEKCIFVMFTKFPYNPYIIKTENTDEVSEYLCRIKKKDE